MIRRALLNPGSERNKLVGVRKLNMIEFEVRFAGMLPSIDTRHYLL
jgi:hypothetical protein